MQNPFFYNNLYVMQKTLTQQGTTRGLSPNIWSRVAGGMLSTDGLLTGYFNGDDFTCFGDTYTLASNLGRYAGEAGAYRAYQDTGDVITQLATEVGGVIDITTTTTDNNETWIQPGQATSVFGKVASTSSKLMIFECRVRMSQVTDTYNMFAGMSEEGLAAADTITDAGALASKDLIGFWVLEADGDSLKYGYRKAGQTAQTLGTYGTALAATTWYKLGWVFDPSPQVPPSKRLTFFVNNVEQTTYGTDSLISAATFPDGEELNFLLGIKNQTNVGKSLQCDWYAMYQAG